MGFREATLWSVFYIGVALAFGAVVFLVSGAAFGAEYFAAYLVEKTLRVDNLFVFVIIMAKFSVPDELPAAGAAVRYRRRPRAAGDLHRDRRRR